MPQAAHFRRRLELSRVHAWHAHPGHETLPASTVVSGRADWLNDHSLAEGGGSCMVGDGFTAAAPAGSLDPWNGTAFGAAAEAAEDDNGGTAICVIPWVLLPSVAVGCPGARHGWLPGASCAETCGPDSEFPVARTATDGPFPATVLSLDTDALLSWSDEDAVGVTVSDDVGGALAMAGPDPVAEWAAYPSLAQTRANGSRSSVGPHCGASRTVVDGAEIRVQVCGNEGGRTGSANCFSSAVHPHIGNNTVL